MRDENLAFMIFVAFIFMRAHESFSILRSLLIFILKRLYAPKYLKKSKKIRPDPFRFLYDYPLLKNKKAIRLNGFYILNYDLLINHNIIFFNLVT